MVQKVYLAKLLVRVIQFNTYMMINMKEIIYSCPWQGKDKTKSWSGTHWSMHEALSQYFNLVEFDSTTGDNSCKVKANDVRIKIMRKISGFSDYDISHRIIANKVFSNKFKNHGTVFQFDEVPNLPYIDSWIYQDLSVCNILRLKETAPEVFKVCGRGNIKDKYLLKREKEQREFYKNAAGIFTMGKWHAKELVEIYPWLNGKVFPVGGGFNVDANRIDYANKNGKRMLFIGRDFERKNGPLVLEAFRQLYCRDSRYELYIAGPKRLNINQNGVRFMGDLPYSKLIDLYNLCDIFVMPSKFEAYGLVFAEALSFGLPCIGRNAFEMPYFIQNGETGYILDDENPDALAELMRTLLDNDEIKTNVINRRDWYLKEYSWDSVAKRIVNIINLS